jgi:AcrR family transcriptional regulator
MKANKTKKSTTLDLQRLPSKGELAKTAILDCSVKLFAKNGFHNTSFQMIADACSLSQAAVIYHFPSRDKLLEAILNKIVEKNHKLASQNADIYDNAFSKLQKHFLGNLNWAVSNRDEAQIILLVYYYATNNVTFTEIYNKILHVGRQRILESILAGIRENIFFPKNSPEIVTQILHEALMGGIINTLAREPKMININQIQDAWNILIEQLLGVKKVN